MSVNKLALGSVESWLSNAMILKKYYSRVLLLISKIKDIKKSCIVGKYSYKNASFTLVVIEQPIKKNSMQIPNRNIVLYLGSCIFRRKMNESRTHSARDRSDPKPIVIIIMKKKMHHTQGKGMRDKASG
jgi:hypothetical protein